jgi:hypothetical protein
MPTNLPSNNLHRRTMQTNQDTKLVKIPDQGSQALSHRFSTQNNIEEIKDQVLEI